MFKTPRHAQLALFGGVIAVAMSILYGAIPYTHSHLMYVTSVFGALWTMWTIYPDFQHGMIVPILAAVIIYTRRKNLMELPVRGWWPGIFFVVFALGIFWTGRRVDNQYIGFISIQITLITLVLWMLGWRWLHALAFPLAFLFFAWPMPFLDNLVTFPLRLLMSSSSVFVLHLLGVDAVQQGTAIISAPNPALGAPPGGIFAVDVADPCSGIRSLFALMMVSALYGYFVFKTPGKRLTLFIASIPLAVAGNLARILCLTFGTIILGPKIAIGTLEHPSLFHMVAGYVVFLVALGGMLLLTSFLNQTPAELRTRWTRWKKGAVSRKTAPIAERSIPVSTQPDLY